MRLVSTFFAVTFALAAAAACAPKQVQVVQGVRITEDKPGLAGRVTLPADSAIRIALARVPGGRVMKGEIEEEHGRLVYSFDIKVEGRSGIEEVLVDARTGEVVAVEHERD